MTKVHLRLFASRRRAVKGFVQIADVIKGMWGEQGEGRLSALSEIHKRWFMQQAVFKSKGQFELFYG